MEEIFSADLSVQHHVQAVLTLLDEYAQADAGGVQLSERVKSDLVDELRKRQNAHVVLAFVEGEPAGIAICFEESSIWPFRPKLSVYDLIVAQTHRGRGISQCMLAKAEEISAQAGCSKLTVEVQEEGVKSLPYCGVKI
ncbi:MAG: GNAT family N-acetyltransferase [Sideroxydans sp.]|jgi:GNAT superfamily N-acetyltransferase